MLFSPRPRRFLSALLVGLLLATPALTAPRIDIDSASLVLQPPSETTANCPIDGHYWSDTYTTPTIKFRIRKKKTGETDVNYDDEKTGLTSGFSIAYSKLMTAIGYDSSWSYELKAWLIDDDDQAVAQTAWKPLAVSNGGS